MSSKRILHFALYLVVVHYYISDREGDDDGTAPICNGLLYFLLRIFIISFICLSSFGVKVLPLIDLLRRIVLVVYLEGENVDGDVTNASVVLVVVMAMNRRVEERVNTLLIIVDDDIGFLCRPWTDLLLRRLLVLLLQQRDRCSFDKLLNFMSPVMKSVIDWLSVNEAQAISE